MNAFIKSRLFPALVAAAILLSGNASAQNQPTASSTSTAPAKTARNKLPFTIGKDTTVITEPLKADGTPDYLAVMEASASKGVTKENNAAVILVQALGTKELLNDKYAKQVLAIIHASPNEAVKPLDLKAYDKLPDKARDAALDGPWKAADHPEIAQWLQANRQALALVVEASKRPRFYLPLEPPGYQGDMVNVLIPNLASVRKIGRVLVIRSNLAMAEGRVRDAWEDILTVERLGGLMAQDTTLIGRLVSIAVTALADKAAISLAKTGQLDRRQARAFLADAQALPPTAEIIPVVDRGERFFTLDLIMFAARETAVARITFLKRIAPVGPMKLAMAPSATSSSSHATSVPADDADLYDIIKKAVTTTAAQSVADAADWDGGLRRVNKYYDRLIASMRLTDLAKREEAAATLHKWLKDLQESINSLPKPGTQAYRDYLPDMYILAFVPSLTKAQTLADRIANERHRLVIAMALAAYKADHGQYPSRLGDLAGDYLKQIPQSAWGKPFVYKVEDKGYVLEDPNESLLKKSSAASMPLKR